MAFLGLWSGKLLILLLRLAGRGGSTLPGRLAARLSPQLLSRLAGRTRYGSAVVTGTNGKTTTSRLLAAAAAAHGWRVTHNRSGANLISGITTAYVAAAGWGGAGRDLAVCEVDEATVPAAVRAIAPRVALVTNFFRDQLDRYGELATAVDLVRRGLAALPAGATAVLNADDPLVAGLAGDLSGRDLRFLYYGVEVSGATSAAAAPSDAGQCPSCGAGLRYTAVHYAHLGHYGCPSCGWRRPQPQVVLTAFESHGVRGSGLRIAAPDGEVVLQLPLGGLYNAYNALAAAAAAHALGLGREAVSRAFESGDGAFGRMESIRIGDKEALLMLVKNPVGLSEALRAVLDDPDESKVLVIAINDLAADGRDVSWLWDADVEQLGVRSPLLGAVVAAGLRAEDMALRLKYAGAPADRLVVERGLERALRAGLDRVPPGGRLYVLPTYTALIETRRLMSRLGWARRFWEV